MVQTYSKDLSIIRAEDGSSIGTTPVLETASGSSAAVIYGPVDILDTRYVMVSWQGTFSCSITIETSPDAGTTWDSAPYHQDSLQTTGWGTTSTGSVNRTVSLPVNATQFRVRISAYTSGTVNLKVVRFSSATFPTLINAYAICLGYQAHDAVISGNNPVLLGAYASNTIPTAVSANGDLVQLHAARSGALGIHMPGVYQRISTATTTTVKSGAGHLSRIIVNKTTTGTVTIYDNTTGSGTVISLLPIGSTQKHIEFGSNFTTGLTIVTSAADDITVVIVN